MPSDTNPESDIRVRAITGLIVLATIALGGSIFLFSSGKDTAAATVLAVVTGAAGTIGGILVKSPVNDV